MTRYMPAAMIAAVPLAGPLEFRAAMREFANTVSIVTTGRGDDRRGLTITSLCSLSADPPSILVCVNKAAEGHNMIQRYGSFCVNVASAEHESLADCFAGRTERRGIDRFTQGVWTTLATGSPVLKGAIGVLDCDVIGHFDQGSHSIFVGGVRVAQAQSGRPVLVYRAGSYQSG
jgi:flavin reductase (DIM6/NTAB) family NADH-FMN oxidoreductase RutF